MLEYKAFSVGSMGSERGKRTGEDENEEGGKARLARKTRTDVDMSFASCEQYLLRVC